MNVEKIMNGYILIALIIIILLGRLLVYALSGDVTKTINSFSFFCHLMGLAVYIYCLFLVKKQGKIDSFW
ncbi:hypothetical protein [Staphylococcus sp. 17KM0847]|uniref:hypothetical protein n=1 Tax=Staphylococcus sp. 17KM0847 TaxID=2583989 RepID=UPI0015DD3093|nr:hypothetical protein [Staphylococcus sp. 17KM0847]QLK85606.1 hypothetical protein FGL66_02220 [Staphylococcus sp. 17KM0847]